MAYPGKATAAGQAFVWNGTRGVWQSITPANPRLVTPGLWKRVAETPVGRAPYLDRIYNIGDDSTACSATAFFDPSGTKKAKTPNRLMVLEGGNPTRVKFYPNTLSRSYYASTTVSGYLVTAIGVYNDDPDLGAVGTYFFAAGSNTGAAVNYRRFIENANGTITVLDSVTLPGSSGLGVTRPYYDGYSLWIHSGDVSGNAQIRRLYNLFGTAGTFAVDPVIYGDYGTDPQGGFLTSNGITHDGKYTYILLPGAYFSGYPSRIYKIDQVSLATTLYTYSAQNKMFSITFDGESLWVGRTTGNAPSADGKLARINPSTMAFDTEFTIGNIQGTHVNDMQEIAFDGAYIWAIANDASTFRRFLLRFDPRLGRVVGAYLIIQSSIPSIAERWGYDGIQIVPSDRGGGYPMVHMSRTGTGSKQEIYVVRDLVDKSVCSLDVTGGLFFPPLQDGATSPIQLKADTSVYLLDPDSYTSPGPTVRLPTAPVDGTFVTICFRVGVTNSIVVTTFGDGSTIDGAASYTIDPVKRWGHFCRSGNAWYLVG